MKLATSRKHDGAITVRGENFEVVVYPAGYVRITGAATFERVIEQFEATSVYAPPADPDTPSPRSKPAAKKRGSK